MINDRLRIGYKKIHIFGKFRQLSALVYVIYVSFRARINSLLTYCRRKCVTICNILRQLCPFSSKRFHKIILKKGFYYVKQIISGFSSSDA